jgi:dihydrofolate reductase
MKLTSTMFLSVDGVYQGPGGPTEDTSGGFERGGWLVPHFDEATGAFMNDVFGRVDAFLLGRRTYDIFAAYWPTAADPGDPTANKLNALPKYVASTTLRDPTWEHTTVVGGDVVDAVRELKGRRGNELQVHGSGMLVRSLFEKDLLDELNLLVFPVIVGAGRRLFPESALSTGLVLESSRTTPSGVLIATYRTAGRPEFGEIPGA